MATLSIPFPDGTKKLTLQGNRITIGRLPDNLIQVRDLTISGRHAELILEGEHYRVHDLQSTNGVFVDGQQVEDFHLHEGCQLRLGTVECEFSAAAESTDDAPAELVPTHIEMRALKQANAELKTQVEALRGQTEKMRVVRESEAAGEGAVSLEKYDQLAAEVASLQGAQAEQKTQTEALRMQLAVLSRERDNLQRAYDDARATLEKTQAGESVKAAPPQAVVARAQAIATPAPQPKSPLATTGPISAPPAPSAPRAPQSVPQGAPGNATVARPAGGGPTIPLAPPIQAAPVAPALVGMPKPPAMPPRPMAVPAAQPGVMRPAAAVARSENAQAAPLPKPPGSLTGSTPVRRPPSAVQPQPVKPLAAAPAVIGPKGTQKLEE